MEKQEKKKRKWSKTAKAELYVPQASGGYRYIGKYYTFSPNQSINAKRYLLILTGLSLLTAVLIVGSGLLNSPGMHNTFYVIIPFIGSFICSVACVWASGRAMYYGDPLKEYVYSATVVRLRGLTVIQAVCSVLTAAGETVFFFLSAAEEQKLSILLAFDGQQLLAAASSLAAWRFVIRYKWEKNDS